MGGGGGVKLSAWALLSKSFPVCHSLSQFVTVCHSLSQFAIASYLKFQNLKDSNESVNRGTSTVSIWTWIQAKFASIWCFCLGPKIISLQDTINLKKLTMIRTQKFVFYRDLRSPKGLRNIELKYEVKFLIKYKKTFKRLRFFIRKNVTSSRVNLTKLFSL